MLTFDAYNHLIMRGITEGYHRHELDSEAANALSEKAIKEAEFENSEQIFEGVICDRNLIATRIFRGTQYNQPTVLKVQFLRPHREEAVIMQKINERNHSTGVRHPHVYGCQEYDSTKGYGYTLMEDVKGKPIFRGLASEEEMRAFADFYETLHSNGIERPPFGPKIYERDARTATALRIANWSAIALKKGTLDREGVGHNTRHLIQMALKGTGAMEFTHGHLTSEDVVVTDKGEKVMFSPSFWRYCPRYYDTTFQILASLNGLKGDAIPTPEAAVAHAEQWKKVFQALPKIQGDPDFSQYFASNIREGAIRGLLLDINKDHQGADNKKQKQVFKALLQHFS